MVLSWQNITEQGIEREGNENFRPFINAREPIKRKHFNVLTFWIYAVSSQYVH